MSVRFGFRILRWRLGSTNLAKTVNVRAWGVEGPTAAQVRVPGAIRNLRELPYRYPRLGTLLAGREQLPALPEQPPAWWTRLTALGGLSYGGGT
jgi:hypothetical protein